MDIASALGATPPAPPKKEPATAPAPSDRDAAANSSFEDEFDSATSPVRPAEQKPAGTKETKAPSDGAAADGALLINAEASASTEEIVAAVVEEIQGTAEETPAILPSPDGEPALVEEILPEIAPEFAAHAGEPVEIESAPPFEEPESDSAADDGAIAAAPAPAPITSPVVIVAPLTIPATETKAALETASAAPVEAVAAATEEPVQTPVIPEAREKPWMPAVADRLQAYARNAQDTSADESLAAMRTGAIEISHAAPHKAETHAATAADGASVAGQVTAAIRADRGAGSVDVRLDPPELGRVRIHFNMERADVVVATVSSERGETLDLLRRHSADLVRELERAGFASVQLDFAAGDNRAFASWDQPEHADYGVLPEGMADEQIVTFVRKAQGRLDRFV